MPVGTVIDPPGNPEAADPDASSSGPAADRAVSPGQANQLRGDRQLLAASRGGHGTATAAHTVADAPETR